MRSDRFQPSGPVRDPEQGTFRLELNRAVPLGALIAAVSALLTWSYTAGGAVSSQAAINASLADRIARLETAEAKDIAALRSDASERMARQESATSLQFSAWDKRGDARMAMLAGKFDTSDKRDEELLAQMNALNIRLTRIEALREFNAQNGPGEAGRFAPGQAAGSRK